MIDVLTLAGTGEQPCATGQVYGMPQFVTRALDPQRFRSSPVLYPASYGPAPRLWGIDYESSVAIGLRNLRDAIEATDNRVGVIAYSQGAAVLSLLLEGIADGRYPDIELSFAALIANPHRGRGHASIDGTNNGYGIAGSHRAWPGWFPIWEVANPADPIPSCPPNSPLRGFADLTRRFSFADPAQWGVDLVEAAIEHRSQQWWLPGWWDARRAVDDALNYLVRGEHSAYVSKPVAAFGGRTYCEELAWLINAGSWE